MRHVTHHTSKLDRSHIRMSQIRHMNESCLPYDISANRRQCACSSKSIKNTEWHDEKDEQVMSCMRHTHPFASHDSFVCLDLTHACVWHDSFMYANTVFPQPKARRIQTGVRKKRTGFYASVSMWRGLVTMAHWCLGASAQNTSQIIWGHTLIHTQTQMLT